MEQQNALKEKFIKGWNTWNNSNMLSQVRLPSGFGINLGFKEQVCGNVINEVLVGGGDKDLLMPRAHAYDNSYTHVEFKWRGIAATIKTATDGDDVVFLVTPHMEPYWHASLIVQGVSLWNRGNLIRKDGDCIVSEFQGEETRVYITCEDIEEVYAYCYAPYLVASLDGEVGVSSGKRRTLEEIKAIIARGESRWQENKEKYGKNSELYNAIQTCLAWDTTYDPQENMVFTTVSRSWNITSGGYVLFCWDTFFAANMAAIDNKELAYLNAIAILKKLTPAGFVPNFACGTPTNSWDRSQPPVGSGVVLRIYQKYQEKWFLEEVFEPLYRWNQWFYEHRQTKNGLLAWGSDPYDLATGREFRGGIVNAAMGAKFESGLDNSPMYDDVPFDEETHRFLLDDVGLTGLYIEDCRCLSEIAKLLGKSAESELLMRRCHEFEENMEQLWCEEVGMYLNRRTDTNAFSYRMSPTNFYALYSKKVSKEHCERILKEHFYNTEEFYGDYIMPSIARNDPAYPDQDYWRGRIWAPLNFLVYLALNRQNLTDARADLAEKSQNMLLKEWLEKGHIHENYCPNTGEGCNAYNSDCFYHWGGLLALMGLMEQGQF